MSVELIDINVLRSACQARRESAKSPSELETVQAELIRVKGTLDGTQLELNQTRNSLGAKVLQLSQVELTLKNRVKELQTERTQTQTELNQTQTELKEAHNSIETGVARFNQVELALKNRIVELETELEACKNLLDVAELAISNKQDFIDRGMAMDIASLEAQYKNQVETLGQQVEFLLKDNAEKQDMFNLMSGKLLQPRYFNGVKPMEILGDKFINYLLADEKSAVLDAHAVGSNWVELKPRIAIAPKVVRDKLELLGLVARLEEGQNLDLKVIKGLFKFEITEPAKPEAKPATESARDSGVPADWFSNLVLTGEASLMAGVKQRPQHLKICGESESGKSATVSNGIDILKAIMPDLKVLLADPLYETGESSWNMQAHWKSDETCQEAILWTAGLVEQRKESKHADRTPTLVIVDEIDVLLEGRKDLSAAIKMVWKQGRHQGVWLWVLGQSPNASAFPGFTLSDFNNAVCIYLNQCAAYAIEQQKPIPMKLMNKYFEMTETERYITLVKPKRGKPFLSPSVKPDSFKEFQSAIPVDVISRPTESADLPTEPDFTQKILAYHSEGLTASQIVERIWDLKPSRSQDYQDRVALVKRTTNL